MVAEISLFALLFVEVFCPHYRHAKAPRPQGSNPHHSSDPGLYSDNIRSLPVAPQNQILYKKNISDKPKKSYHIHYINWSLVAFIPFLQFQYSV